MRSVLFSCVFVMADVSSGWAMPLRWHESFWEATDFLSFTAWRWLVGRSHFWGSSGRCVSAGAPLPVFRGFEAARYQRHDALILRLVAEFNADKATGCGGTSAQADEIPDLCPALVKAQMIEESGGNSPRSVAAWNRDPLQVNVPGDWGDEKLLLGLVRPTVRNEGTLEGNVRAAIRYLARKGFGKAGVPAALRPAGFFDSWKAALRRYNGRWESADGEGRFCDKYADRIIRRAQNPGLLVPIGVQYEGR